MVTVGSLEDGIDSYKVFHKLTPLMMATVFLI